VNKELLTLVQAARVLQIKYARAAELARSGVMPGVVRLGRQIRINPEALERFIESGGVALPGGWRREER